VDDLLERGRNWLSGILIVAALGAGLALAYPLVQRPAAPPVQLVATPIPPTPPPSEVYVHVTGAVLQPGLYTFPAGSRVGDAVAAAGAADDADLDALNLAARLVDGQRLAVPRRSEAAPASASAPRPTAARALATPRPAGTKLNLNTATAAELDALPGIGPALARRIIDYRERHGPFRSVQQLRDARLLPAATYERIRDLVTVE